MYNTKRSEEKFILLFENSPIGMAMVSHTNGEFLEVNNALLNILGYSKDEFLKLSFWDITPEEYYFQEKSQIEELNATGKFGPNEKEYIKKDGKRVPIRLSGFKLIDIDEKPVVWGVIENITAEKELKEQHAKIKQLSITDHLTGLFNRQKLDEALEYEITRAARFTSNFSLIMMDLDYFKNVNDIYGHQVGDEVLKAISKILQDNTRIADIVGRWGGEEFMIICPEINAQEAVKLAEKIRLKIQNHLFSTVGNKTSSFGVASYELNDETKSIVTRVDKALYEAKEQGRNRVICL